MTTTDVLDKRQTDLETIVWDLPGLLTTRTAKYEAEFTAIRDRLDKIERNQGMLQVDMRDLRNGVARFMVEFDGRMRSLEERVERLEAGQKALAAQQLELAAQQKDLAAQQKDLAAKFDAHAAKTDATLAEILRRLPKA